MTNAHDKNKVLALGFFDGVHLGHGALLSLVVQRAKELGAVPGAVSFDVHPSQLLSETPAPLLTTPAERTRLMEQQYGLKEILIAHFDETMMHMPWRQFLTDYLFRQCGAVHLVAGHDYSFGYKGEGNTARLAETCAQYGIGCDIVPPVTMDGVVVSSTCIRSLLLSGDVDRARHLLGHPYGLTGTVAHGHRLGSRLGFPTVNLRVPEELLIPARGVYITRACLADGRSFASVTNIGIRPTVETCNGSVSVEAFLLDFSGDLYDCPLRLDFYHFLRSERKFDSLDALKAAIMENAGQAREYFL